ncbi:hypothetical protein [Altericista sp. CCNU0014]|uniref:hypothetical protein n=1 Tax=Altericista sp. CCNU0014 TaxID=3082949 RepID=UPI0038506244
MLSVNPIFSRQSHSKLMRCLQSFARSGKGLLFSIGSLIALSAPASFAQSSSPPDVAKFVYQRIPTLALENQYVRTDNNKQAVDSTLVSRLVYYHNSVKGRSPLYRLDWKTTLADYLGIHEVIQPETYSGYAFLKKNPLESDRAVIQKLNAAQRNALVQALVDASTGRQSAASETTKTAPPSVPAQAKSKPAPAYRPTLNPLAAPGSVDSLRTAPIGRPYTPGGGEAQFLK